MELRYEAKTRGEEYAEHQRMSQLCPASPTDHDWLRPLRKPNEASKQDRGERNHRQFW